MTRLTTQQESCIHFPRHSQKKHLIIEAGAGAGKTFVLTERVAHLLDPRHRGALSPTRLYLVTFSRAAEAELQERVRKKISESFSPQMAELVHISTIDSLLMKLLESKYASWWESAPRNYRDIYAVANHAPQVQLATESLVLEKLEARLVDVVRESCATPEHEGQVLDFILAGGFRTTFSRGSTRAELLKALLSESFLSPMAKPLTFASQSIHPASAALLQSMLNLARQEYLKRIFSGVFTHNDRTLFLHSLLCMPEQKRGNTPFEVRGTPPILPLELIVDEYQDTNELQHELLFSLLPKNEGRMVVVGDPKQSIYGFRNAHVGVFKSLTTHSDWEHIELKTNFRSRPDLLNEMNSLSELAFSYQDPELPPEFLNSEFYRASLKYSIGANPLIAGATADVANTPPVILVSASLNESRCSQPLPELKSIRLADFQSWALSQSLKDLRTKNNSPWREFVVLCETNSRAQWIAESLSKFGVPAMALCKGKQGAEQNAALFNQVALTLLKLLVSPVEVFELYQIFVSPLLSIPHECVVHFFRNLNSGNLSDGFASIVHTPHEINFKGFKTIDSSNYPIVSAFARLIEDARTLASINPFAAWQTLRWNCTRLASTENQEDSRRFCIQMDRFASLLSNYLSSKVTRREFENVTKDRELLKTFGWPIPSYINLWDFSAEASGFAGPHEDTVKVMTVHAAKGLEWNYVTFWPNSPRNFSPEFSLLLSTERVFIKWLQGDDESLSVLRRRVNPDFKTEDSVTLLQKGVAKTRWFADLQKSVERDFERQRVFYTAFTRAREQLILMYPPAHLFSRKSWRDKLAEVKKEENDLNKKLKIKRLDDAVLVNYTDSLFDFRKQPDSDTPASPWFGYDKHAKKKTNNEAVCFHEFGPDWAGKYLEDARSPQNNSETAVESPATIKRVLTGLHTVETSQPLDWTAPPRGTVAADFAQRHSSNSISQRDLQINSSEIGIRYHAAQEHVGSSDRSPISMIRRSAEGYRHEYEIWIKNEESSSRLTLSSPKRRVLDFISVHTLERFPKSLLQAPVSIFKTQADTFESQTSLFQDHFAQFTQKNLPFLLIADFKTAWPSDEHVEQMREYVEAAQKFASLSWVDGFLNRQMTLFQDDIKLPVIGVLFYDFAPLYSHLKLDRRAFEDRNLFFTSKRFAVEFFSTTQFQPARSSRLTDSTVQNNTVVPS